MSLKKEFRYLEATKLLQQRLSIESTDSEKAALHIIIGVIFCEQMLLGEAEEHFIQAKVAAENAKDNEGLAVALGNLGAIYRHRGDLSKARKHLELALLIYQDIPSIEGIANVLSHIADIYKVEGELDNELWYGFKF